MNREVAVVALGRFLVVERYRETHQPPSTHHPLRGPGEERTGEHASRPGVHPHGVDWAPFAAAFIAAVAVLDSGKRAAAGLQPAGRGNGGWR
jgi:hypothetical protein